MFYTVPGATPLPQLMNDALILAHASGGLADMGSDGGVCGWVGVHGANALAHASGGCVADPSCQPSAPLSPVPPGHDVFNALDIFENEKILKGALPFMPWGFPLLTGC